MPFPTPLPTPLLCSAPTFKIEDAEARLKARQEVAAGPLADKLKMMTKLVVSKS
jgi:hypothetical protein